MPEPDDSEFLTWGQCNFQNLIIYRIPETPVFHRSRDAFEDLVNRIATTPRPLDALSRSSRLIDIAATHFEIRPLLHSFATYSQTTVTELFPTLRPNLLPFLINAHLHEHFLRQHPVIVIVDPIQYPKVGPQLSHFADSLRLCPISPLPNSCPPGSMRCVPCRPASVACSRSLAGLDTNSFILSVIRHPFTYLCTTRPDLPVDSRFLLETPRDEWVQQATSGIKDERAGSVQRIRSLNHYIEDSLSVFASRLPPGSWQTLEELDIASTEYDLGFEVKSSKAEFETDDEVENHDQWTDVARPRISDDSDNLGQMVELWNLGWSELWYHL
jgi:hypothetical protein